MYWCVSNTLINLKLEEHVVQKEGENFILSHIHFLHKMSEEITIGIEGHVIPRSNFFYKYGNLKKQELVFQLYLLYKENFINYIKGSFVIILIDKKEINIYNDTHSLKKYFVYNNQSKFLISNSVKLISRLTKLEFDQVNAILYCLFEHFVDGNMMFKHLLYSKPASLLKIENNLLILSQYWSECELLTLRKSLKTFEEYSIEWKDIISQYFVSLPINKPTLTLTGGNDSRMILAAILNLQQNLSAFNFGDPTSFDCVVAKELSVTSGIELNNFNWHNPTAEEYKFYTDQIVHLGNSLINIHRAHRLFAMEKELSLFPEIDAVFGGFMGGDYIKGIIYDDYITAKIFRLLNHKHDQELKFTGQLLKEKYIYVSDINLDAIINKINGLSFINSSKEINEFRYVFNVVGSMHDYQDISVFNSKLKYCINPFMDIDFLNLLFSSKFSMLEKKNTSKNQLKRLLQPEFQIRIINLLKPELSNVRFAKKGYYTPNEFLGNKIIYLARRTIRMYQNQKYQQNFPYGAWFREYCMNELKNVNSDLQSLFDLDSIHLHLNQKDHPTTEGYWHIFSNIINLDRNLKYFGYEK